MNESSAMQELMRYHNCEDYYLRLLKQYPDEEMFIQQRIYELKAVSFNQVRKKHPMYLYQIILAAVEQELIKKYKPTGSVTSGTTSDTTSLQEISTELVIENQTSLSSIRSSISAEHSPLKNVYEEEQLKQQNREKKIIRDKEKTKSLHDNHDGR